MAATGIAIRWLHVFGMALVLGGAVLAWGAIRRLSETGNPSGRRLAVAIAETYETVFWGAVGVLVMTGVGNLGTLAPAVPTSSSPWGRILLAKLLSLLAFLALSLLRTLVVHRVGRTDAAGPASNDVRLLRLSYGATSLYAVGLLALAEVLAHG